MTELATILDRAREGTLDEEGYKKLKAALETLGYLTDLNGAHVGDLFMSLIHTCELCKADPFDYLNELQLHAKELAENPQNWLPWNYRENLQQSALPHPAPP